MLVFLGGYREENECTAPGWSNMSVRERCPSIILSRLSLPRIISLLASEPSLQPRASLSSSLFGETTFVSHRGGTMDRMQGLWRYPITRVVVLAIFLPVLVLGGVISLGLHTLTTTHAAGGCQLHSAKGAIQHV